MIADGAHVRRGVNRRLENLSVNSNYVRENLSDVCCVNLCLGILVDFSCGFLKSVFIVPVDNCNHENTSYIIGHNYHGHYWHAGRLSVNNYVRENNCVSGTNVRNCVIPKSPASISIFCTGFSSVCLTSLFLVWSISPQNVSV